MYDGFLFVQALSYFVEKGLLGRAEKRVKIVSFMIEKPLNFSLTYCKKFSVPCKILLLSYIVAFFEVLAAKIFRSF